MSSNVPTSKLVPVEEWTTPEVAEWLGIGCQAVNKRARTGTLLGYRSGKSRRFPAWQFDLETGTVRPEVAALLAAAGSEVDHQALAEWVHKGSIPSFGAAPLKLLLTPETRDDVLEFVRDSPDPRQLADRTGSSMASGDFLRLLREQRSGDAQDAQTAILWAAAELFARHGPTKVSLRSVAAAAGVSYGLIYRFYHTKENLLSSVVELLATSGTGYVAEQPDVYAAIRNTLGSDAGRWGRMISWAVLDGVSPADLFRNVRVGGYRQHIETLWAAPVPPTIRRRFDSHVVACLVTLLTEMWTTHQPYLSRIAGADAIAPEEQNAQVVEMLQLLVWNTRPQDDPVGVPIADRCDQ